MIRDEKELLFDSNIFSKDVILKACYELSALATFDISYKESQIKVTVSVIDAEQRIVECCDQLKNLAIDYQLREKINEQTHSIKELLINAALKEAGVVKEV